METQLGKLALKFYSGNMADKRERDFLKDELNRLQLVRDSVAQWTVSGANNPTFQTINTNNINVTNINATTVNNVAAGSAVLYENLASDTTTATLGLPYYFNFNSEGGFYGDTSLLTISTYTGEGYGTSVLFNKAGVYEIVVSVRFEIKVTNGGDVLILSELNEGDQVGRFNMRFSNGVAYQQDAILVASGSFDAGDEYSIYADLDLFGAPVVGDYNRYRLNSVSFRKYT